MKPVRVLPILTLLMIGCSQGQQGSTAARSANEAPAPSPEATPRTSIDAFHAMLFSSEAADYSGGNSWDRYFATRVMGQLSLSGAFVSLPPQDAEDFSKSMRKFSKHFSEAGGTRYRYKRLELSMW